MAESTATAAEGRAAAAKQQEDAARRAAEAQSRLAISNRLAGDALENVDNAPDLSLLLGASSYATYPGDAAHRSLLAPFQRYPRLLRTVRGRHRTPVTRIVGAKDAFVSRANDGSAVLWDGASLEPRLPLGVSAGVFLNIGAVSLGDVSLSPLGSTAAVLRDGELDIWDTTTHRRRLSTSIGVERDPLLVDDERLVVSGPDGLELLELARPADRLSAFAPSCTATRDDRWNNAGHRRGRHDLPMSVGGMCERLDTGRSGRDLSPPLE